MMLMIAETVDEQGEITMGGMGENPAARFALSEANGRNQLAWQPSSISRVVRKGTRRCDRSLGFLFL